jgi:hypothetical protein
LPLDQNGADPYAERGRETPAVQRRDLDADYIGTTFELTECSFAIAERTAFGTATLDPRLAGLNYPEPGGDIEQRSPRGESISL